MFQRRKQVYKKARKPQLPELGSGGSLIQPAHMTQSVRSPAHHSKAIPINNNITIGGAKPVELASPVAVGNSAAVTESIVSTAAAAVARGRFVEDRVPEFDWTLYLKQSKLKAVPHSAFKHVSVDMSYNF